MKRAFLFGCILLLVGIAAFFIFVHERQKDSYQVVTSPEQVSLPPEETLEESAASSEEIVVEETRESPLPEKTLIAGVPFTSQAPFAEWNDPTFQNACEEASLIMAEAWVNEKTLSKESAKKEILALAAFQKKKFGHAIDTSIGDTAAILREYYGLTGKVERDVTIETIERALSLDQIVIVPADGRKLSNPNFTQPGPPRHMLVIIGYDNVTKEFITNDPGTRNGASYHYPQAILYDAILDYPTGNHGEVTSTDKVMLTVSKVMVP